MSIYIKQLIVGILLGFSATTCAPITDVIPPSPPPSFTPTIITPHTSSPHTPGATTSLTPTPYVTPLPTSTSIATATTTPMPIPTETPWWRDALLGFEHLLPVDSEPSYEQIWEWAMRRGCTSSRAIIFVPYKLPDDKWNIVAIAGQDRNNPDSKPSIYWDWQQETTKPGYWQELRYLESPRGWIMGSYLGLDEQGQWWIVVLHGQCETPSVYAMFPVTNPEKVSLEASWLEQEKRILYWVVDDTLLKLYEWKDDSPIGLWTLESVPDVVVFPRLEQDFTGDDEPELTLTWGQGTNRLLHIYQTEDRGFKLIGEVETSYHQYYDVDGDLIGEFLWPTPQENPTEWKIYGWDGVQFAWKEALPKPAIQSTIIESPPTSSVCPFDLVEVGHYEGSSYNVSNSDGTINWEVPNTFTYTAGHSTFAWGENCQFLIHARADGGNGLYRLDLSSGNVETLLPLTSTRGYGAVHPITLTNGDIIFTIQGQEAKLYPPLGVYRLTADGDLQLLADIPPLLPNAENLDYIKYGTLTRSPTGEFVYQSP